MTARSGNPQLIDFTLANLRECAHIMLSARNCITLIDGLPYCGPVLYCDTPHTCIAVGVRQYLCTRP